MKILTKLTGAVNFIRSSHCFQIITVNSIYSFVKELTNGKKFISKLTNLSLSIRYCPRIGLSKMSLCTKSSAISMANEHLNQESSLLDKCDPTSSSVDSGISELVSHDLGDSVENLISLGPGELSEIVTKKVKSNVEEKMTDISIKSTKVPLNEKLKVSGSPLTKLADLNEDSKSKDIAITVESINEGGIISTTENGKTKTVSSSSDNDNDFISDDDKPLSSLKIASRGDNKKEQSVNKQSKSPEGALASNSDVDEGRDSKELKKSSAKDISKSLENTERKSENSENSSSLKSSSHSGKQSSSNGKHESSGNSKPSSSSNSNEKHSSSSKSISSSTHKHSSSSNNKLISSVKPSSHIDSKHSSSSKASRSNCTPGDHGSSKVSDSNHSHHKSHDKKSSNVDQSSSTKKENNKCDKKENNKEDKKDYSVEADKKRKHSAVESSSLFAPDAVIRDPTPMQIKRAKLAELAKERKKNEDASVDHDDSMKNSGEDKGNKSSGKFLWNVHPDLMDSYRLAYEPAGLVCTSKPVRESESAEYGAYDLSLNKRNIKFRTAKLTPTKIGAFVTLWKRQNGKGPIMPIDVADPFDLFVVCVREGNNFGQFVFPKNILLVEGVLSRGGKGGKRAIRVYAPWVKPDSPQAIKSQNWQIRYFVNFSEKSGKINYDQVKRLYAK